jgi:hypothetical protein
MDKTRAIPPPNKVPRMQRVSGEVGDSYTDAKGKKVLEHHSGLHPSEKELMDRYSGVFHHKNTPQRNYLLLCYLR